MTAALPVNPCTHGDDTVAYAAQALAPAEVAGAEAHLASCADCRRELASLRAVVCGFVALPIDVLRPPSSRALQAKLAARLGSEQLPMSQRREPAWHAVAPGIECKLLATDEARKRVSMLVRLAPGARYPAHTHAGVEELFLLHGELWIDGRKLAPGDHNLAAPGTGDESVWSETGCTCVLITSSEDILR